MEIYLHHEKPNSYSKCNRPPIGVIPKEFNHLTDDKRFHIIKNAIKRYNKAGVEIPSKWYEELVEITKRQREVKLRRILK